MSRTIEITNLPDAFVERLEAAAVREGRTLQDMLLEALEEIAPPRSITLGEWFEQETLLRARGFTSRQIVAAVHASRLERDAELEAAWRASRAETRVW